uniref:CCR4-NOT transcription complex subunit 1 n=1 Tax=Eutreptiella gymnastica TaxID=73025 RepID=A0A7S1J542_9EUGL|mmetsp:Transcript_67559/g.119834  ORF Transcript_67559/g.119834 Transcript_67559/m.119834 type:complete len:2502 (+) Transcript_67559:35-7540(+)
MSSSMDLSSCVGSQIKFLLGSLTKQTFNTNLAEIDKVLATFGIEATRYLLGHLLQEVQAENLLDAADRDNLKLRVLNLTLSRFTKDSNFISLLSQVFDDLQARADNEPVNRCDFLIHFCRSLNLPLVVQLSIGLGLAHSCESTKQAEGIQFLKTKLGEVTANVVKTLPDNILLHLLHFVSTTDAFSESERTLLNLESLRQSVLSLNSLGASVKEISVSNRQREIEMGALADDFSTNLNLAGVMEEMGPAATCSKQFFMSLLEQFPVLTSANLAEVIGFLSMNQGGVVKAEDPEVQQCFVSCTALRPDQPQMPALAAAPQSWNPDVFVSCINQKYNVDWRDVLGHLDYPKFEVTSPRGLAFILTLHKKATGEAMPVSPVLGKWSNTTGQLSFLQHLPAAPPDLIDWTCKPGGMQPVRLDGLPRSMFHIAWSSLDLIETLLNLADHEHYSQVRQVFGHPMRSCPDLLLIGLMQAKPSVSQLQKELVGQLLRELLQNLTQGPTSNPNCKLIIPHLMASSPQSLAQGLTDVAVGDSAMMNTVMKVAVDHKWLHQLLDLSPNAAFVATLAATAAESGMLDLGNWLLAFFSGPSSTTMRAYVSKQLLKYVEDKLQQEAERSKNGGREPVFPEKVVDDIFRIISEAAEQLPNPVHEQAKALAADRKNVSTDAQTSAVKSDTSSTFPASVEEEANNYFGKIYTGQMTVDELLELLERFKSSGEAREQQVYDCTIHNLYDEYRFFPKYPEKEMQITAQLFGGLVARNIVVNQNLGIALKCVLQAIAKPLNNKMSQFGTIALDQFKQRLPEWPLYCSRLRAIPNLAQALPGVDAFLDAPPPAEGTPAPNVAVPPAGLAGFQPNRPVQSSAGFGQMAQDFPPHVPPQGSGMLAGQLTPGAAPSDSLPASFGHTCDIGTLLTQVATNVDVPQELADKLSFMMNNLMESNVESTAADIKRFMRGPEYPYFAQYLVIKRASLEPNNHKLYLALLEKINDRELEGNVLHVSYSSAKALMASEKMKTSASERSLLKNIGSWLGHLTIGRNKPVLTRHMELKDLLFESIASGKMIAIVPFVAKILEQSTQSKIFRPPNPWLMGLLMLFVEIHQMPDLKLTLKFEVEVLLKNIGVDMNTVLQLISQKKDKSNQRRLEHLRTEIEQTGSTDFMLKDVTIGREDVGRPNDKDKDAPAGFQVFGPASGAGGAFGGLANNASVGAADTPGPAGAAAPPGSAPGPNGTPTPPGPFAMDGPIPRGPGQMFQGMPFTPPTLPPTSSSPSAPAGIAPFLPPMPGGQNQAPGPFAGFGAGQGPFGAPFPEPSGLNGPFGPGHHSAFDGGLAGPGGHRSNQGVLGPGPGGSPHHSPPEFPANEESHMAHPFLLGMVKLSPQMLNNPILKGKPDLNALVASAMDRATADIIQPCVERSVMIACTTTRELVAKDFATDGDDAKLRHCSHMMAQSLASNLAMVTCKDPLRSTFINHLRANFIKAWGEPQDRPGQDAMQQACEVITQENIDTAVNLVRKTATETAIREIDGSMDASMEERKKARDAGHPYIPRSAGGNQYMSQQFLATLPDALRPKQGGVSGLHKAAYDVFAASLPRTPDFPHMAPVPVPAPAPAPPPDHGLGQSVLAPTESAVMPAHPEAMDPTLSQAASSALQSLQNTLNNIEMEATNHYKLHPPANVSSILSLTHSSFTQGAQSPEHERIKELVCGIHPLIREDTALLFARDIFEKVFSLSDKIIAEQKLLPQQPSTELYVLMLVNEVCLFVLQTAREKNAQVVTQELTKLFLQHEKRWQHKYIAVNFIRLRLINMPDFDKQLTEALQQPASSVSRQIVEFAGSVVQRCLVDEQLITQKDLKNTLEILGKIAKNPPSANQPPPQPADGQSSTADSGGDNASAAVLSTGHGLLSQSASDPALRATVGKLFWEWIGICSGKVEGNTQTLQQQALEYIGKLQHHGMLKAVHVMDKFFGLLMEMSVECCVQELAKTGTAEETPAPERQGAPATAPAHFQTVDAFSDLIVLLIKCCGRGHQPKQGDRTPPSSIVAEVALLTKVVAVVSRVLMDDHDMQLTALVNGNTAGLPWQGFNQQPYFRFFSNLLISLNQVQGEDQIPNNEILTVFSNTFHHLSPLRLPGFAFSWLELISHRMFMPKLLLTKQQDGWPHFQRLLVSALKFLEPSLRSAQLTEAVRMFYKGTLKILLVLLHDFPEFLCNYHFNFCDAIPPSCIQLRNIILSSFPRHMRLPDPFTPNLKVDLLPEITQPPRILSKFMDHLKPSANATAPAISKEEIDSYLKDRQPLSWVQDLHKRLLVPGGPAASGGCQYDIPVMNALVLYVGVSAIAQLQGSTGSTELPQATASIVDSAAMDIYHELITRLDSEGRYLLLNALANHLRYPNNHTHYFSCVVLHLFAEARGPQEKVIQEQITRVLLERLIVNRPHPWGLLISFIELVKNPRYEFWKKPFIHCTPEIERLFDNVGQSCVGSLPKPPLAASEQIKTAAGTARQPGRPAKLSGSGNF